MVDPQPRTDEASASPVYSSYDTFENLVERLEREGIPTQIDKSYLSNLSGGVQIQTLLTLKTLGMIGPNNEVLEPLRRLVTEPENRKAIMRRLVEEHYSWALALGPSATQLQLEEVFKARGERLSTHTRRKAITFYLRAAKYAEIPLSPFFKGKVSSNGSGPRRTGTRRTRAVRKPVHASSTATDASPPIPNFKSEMRHRYFDFLLTKAEGSDQLDEAVLNRIEKLIDQEEVVP